MQAYIEPGTPSDKCPSGFIYDESGPYCKGMFTWEYVNICILLLYVYYYCMYITIVCMLLLYVYVYYYCMYMYVTTTANTIKCICMLLLYIITAIRCYYYTFIIALVYCVVCRLVLHNMAIYRFCAIFLCLQ